MAEGRISTKQEKDCQFFSDDFIRSHIKKELK